MSVPASSRTSSTSTTSRGGSGVARLRAFALRNRRGLLVAGAGGAAALALVARRRPSRPSSSGAADPKTAATGGVDMGYDAVANEVFRSLNPTIGEIQRQLAALQGNDAADKLAAMTAHQQHLTHTAHVRGQTITRLRRQREVRADPSKVRGAADLALLTPAQRSAFERWVQQSHSTPAKQKATVAAKTTYPAAKSKDA